MFLLSQFAGYMTPMDWIKGLFYSVPPVTYFSAGAGMILISIFDQFFFAFHPLEKNIFLDQDRFDNKVLVKSVLKETSSVI